MSFSLIQAGLAVLAVCGLWAGSRAMLTPVVQIESPAPPPPAGPATQPIAELEIEPRLVKLSIARPIFRSDRLAPSHDFDPEREQDRSAPPDPPAPKPALSISGLVWGDQPAAVVEGLPGIEGSMVLREGDSAAGFKVVRIEGERVIIRGLDTTWRLPVKESWR